ncbi:MAG: hypothetical protein ACOH1K_06800 [Rhodoglobus sp.]
MASRPVRWVWRGWLTHDGDAGLLETFMTFFGALGTENFRFLGGLIVHSLS